MGARLRPFEEVPRTGALEIGEWRPLACDVICVTAVANRTAKDCGQFKGLPSAGCAIELGAGGPYLVRIAQSRDRQTSSASDMLYDPQTKRWTLTRPHTCRGAPLSGAWTGVQRRPGTRLGKHGARRFSACIWSGQSGRKREAPAKTQNPEAAAGSKSSELPPRCPTRRRRPSRGHSGHAGRTFLGRFGSRLQSRPAVAARALADPLQRRRRRRLWRRPAQRADRGRQAARLRGGHRRQHRRADRAIRFRRNAIRRGIAQGVTPKSLPPTYFEAGSSTGESFVNSWPLRDFIDKQITPELMADIAAAHRRGRRLFVVTTDLDSQRSVVWNMGAIAAHGGDDAAKLFRNVLLASASIPGRLPAGADRRRSRRQALSGNACGRRPGRTILCRAAVIDGKYQRLSAAGHAALHRGEYRPAAGFQSRRSLCADDPRPSRSAWPFRSTPA